MKTGIIILCRYDSKRLPGKVLKTIAGRPVLSYLYERVKQAGNVGPIIVATSTKKSDDPIAQYCKDNRIECFRGPLDDVASRFLSCAQHYQLDFAVRINGDNVFVDPNTLREMLAIAKTEQFDFISNVKGRTFPEGMSIEILKVPFFEGVVASLTESKHKEHVTLFLYENPSQGKQYHYYNTGFPEAHGVKVALDTEADFNLITQVFSNMPNFHTSYGMKQVVTLARTALLNSPWKGNSGPLLIAEIGGNHEGDFDYAKKLTALAIEAGVDYIKFQLYTGDTLANPLESPDRNRHFKKFELTKEQHIALAQTCRASGVGYLASVWNEDFLSWIDPYMDMYKIGSGDLTAYPMIKEIVKLGKPIILSTGLSTIEEILRTVEYIQSLDSQYNSPERLALLQCTSMYPIKNSDANLSVIETLKGLTGLTIGYSDHTEGGEALRVAYALGAQVLEFHFTDNRLDKLFRDHKVSLTRDEVWELKKDLNKIRELRGNGIKGPLTCETEHRVSFRRAVYPAHNIPVGSVITEADLVCLRPNHGIDAQEFELLLGKVAKVELKKHGKISWDDLERGGGQ